MVCLRTTFTHVDRYFLVVDPLLNQSCCAKKEKIPCSLIHRYGCWLPSWSFLEHSRREKAKTRGRSDGCGYTRVMWKNERGRWWMSGDVDGNRDE